MTKFNVILLGALLASCIYLIQVSHTSRTLFALLDKARAEERLLDNEAERLKSEKQSQATPLRVEKTARDKLAMRTATPAVTQYVSYTGLPATAPAPAVKRSAP